MAHQTLDQLSPRLRAALHANTSTKCVGGVSARDARALADELHTSSDFIESMKRRHGKTEFAAWIKHQTPHAIRLSVPLGFLEQQPILSEEAFGALLDANRAQYCGTRADVVGFAPVPAQETVAPPAPTAASLHKEVLDDVPAAVPEPDRPVPISSIPEAPIPAPTPVEVRPVLRDKRLARETGKGGSQHRYVQHLIKGLAEERGFRAVVEEPVEGGQVDVGLHREGLSIACEISVTSTADYETRNLAKCLRGDFARVFAIADSGKRLKAIEAKARERLSEEDLARIDFLTPEEVATALDILAAPVEETTLVRGYRVKVTQTVVGVAEARDRRATVARIIAQSMRNMPKDE